MLQVEIFTRANSTRARSRATGHTHMQIKQSTKDTSKMDSNTVQAG